MKNWKLRLTSAALALCLAAATAVPAMAAGQTAETATASGSGIIETLLDVPLIGDILRIFVGKDAATPESAATPETALEASTYATPEAAATLNEAAAPTAETPESARTDTPGSPTGWPAAWMQGAVQPGGSYPQGSAEAAQPTATETLWGSVTMYSGAVLRASSREETNLGDLAADALCYAAAAESRYATDPDLNTLPLVAVLDGASLSGTIEPGTLLDETAIAAVLADEEAALVTVTPAKLAEIFNAALVGMLDAQSSNFGSFLQVSGLRYTYITMNGAQQVEAIWLADAASADGRQLDLADTTTKIALVLPKKLLDTYGVNPAAGYTNWFDGAAITLRSAMLALPKNVDADTLAALLARGGSTGRILPVTAANFSAMLVGDYTYANTRMSGILDGRAIELTTDEYGSLIIENLTPGSHTFRMKAGEPGYYISSITHIGTADGSVVQVAAIPADCVLDPVPTAVPTAEPTAAPTAAPTATAAPQADSTADAAEDTYTEQAPTAAPTAVPAAPAAATAAPAAKTTARATAAPVNDPTADEILNATPVPTIEPTPTPTPVVTPEPTTDPEAQARLEAAEKQSARLPLYIGLGVLGVCVVVGGGLLIKRRLDDGKNDKYHKR